ncbi:MAG: hypothetical protein WCE68_05505 [Anaerolineales bacterium]
MTHTIRTFVMRIFVDNDHLDGLRGALDDADGIAHYSFRDAAELLKLINSLAMQASDPSTALTHPARTGPHPFEVLPAGPPDHSSGQPR